MQTLNNYQSELISKLFAQKNNLVKSNPDLEHYFINIYLKEWNVFLPFLPIRCFRDFDLHCAYSEKNQENFKIFLSSGSTGHNRAKHIFSNNSLNEYAKNSCLGFEQFLMRFGFSKKTSIFSLVPKPIEWPTSSLAAMIDMFFQSHFNIIYINIEKDLQIFQEQIKKINGQEKFIIFGTTFHHFSLVQKLKNKAIDQSFFKNLKVGIIDTGGTKGRTQAFTLNESINILKDFYNSEDFSFYSEYGMCELSSQAWSLKNIHDGTFQCNETLHSFSLDLNTLSSCNNFQTGFLSFIDTINSESYGAIITEDLGYTISPGSYKLIGRSPDATLKGCSLNVLNHFQFEDSLSFVSSEKLIQTNQLQGVKIPIEKKEFVAEKTFSLSYLFSLLNTNIWDEFSLHDLKETLLSLENLSFSKTYFSSRLLFPNLKNQQILIICAANTPISWVYPFVICALNSAQSIHLKIPSLRLDDFFVSSVREKIIDLVKIFSSFFPETKVYFDENKSLTKNFNSFDYVLVFGTNETLQTIQSQITNQTTRFIGFGDVKNALKVQTENFSPVFVAKSCAIWNGRGCLTPVALFLDEYNQAWIKIFLEAFESEFSARFQMVQRFSEGLFFHAHNYYYVCGQLKQIGIDPKQHAYKSAATCVFDLTSISLEQLKKFDADFSFSGSSFIYLLPMYSLEFYENKLNFYDLLPKIQETHMGKSWRKILG